MAAPTVRAWGTESAAGTPGLPAGTAENDILVCVVETGASDAITISGYAHVTNSPQTSTGGSGNTNTRLHVFWKRAGASESAPTLTDRGNHDIAQVVAIVGCPTTGDPWDVIAVATVNTADTAVSWPDLTTTVADALIMHFGGGSADTATDQFSDPANSNLTSVTEEADAWTANGNGGGIFVVSGVKAAAGAIGNTTGTLGGNNKQALIVIAFKPETTTDREARVYFSEMEAPTAPRQAFVYFTELETPNAPREARVYWSEMEVPTAPREARVYWAEFEAPNAPREARVYFTELEVPENQRGAQVYWSEFEVPTAPRQAFVYFSELEVPSGPRQAYVYWSEFEVPAVAPPGGETSYSAVHIRRRIRKG